METFFRFINRTDVGIGLIIATLVLWGMHGFGAGLCFFAFCAVLRWFGRVAIGNAARTKSLEERQEDVARVVQNHAGQGARSTPSNLDPAWRNWLNSNDGKRS